MLLDGVTQSGEYLYGIFIEELKNRFLCLVEVGGHEEICYVPSSCHLSNFIELKGKNVLLIPNKTDGLRTKYSLFAVPYKRNYIILNTSMANRVVEYSIRSRRFSFLGKRDSVEREYRYNDYKCDLFIKDTNTIIEIKSIISTQAIAPFPTVFSERGIKQLRHLQRYLQEGLQVVYCIVSLHPYIKRIELDEKTEFYYELKLCKEYGLILKAYSSRLMNDRLVIDREIEIKG